MVTNETTETVVQFLGEIDAAQCLLMICDKSIKILW